MCGINGYIQNQSSSDKTAEQIVADMAERLSHRGPDAQGVWVEKVRNRLALGHRRLSIIDLSDAGAQPMVSASGRYVIVYNGEIYNFQSLSVELTALGYNFNGHSDTEVLLAAMEEWGVEKVLTKFAGMFAFALFDKKENQLTLARDRLGKKPLYFGWDQNNNFAFASELKSIVSIDGFSKPEINQEAVNLYLKWRYVPDPHSIYKNIYKLPPSSFITLPLDQWSQPFEPEEKAKIFWNFKDVVDQPRQNISEQDSLNGLDKILGTAVQERMISDVPIGTFLSGGIDSSLISSMMQEQSDRPVETFTIAFDDPRYNEAEKAKQIADHLGTHHTEMLLKPQEATDTIQHLGHVFDEPFGDPSAIPTYHVCRLAKQKMTVALSGDGGDESFGGYTPYKRIASIVKILNIPRPLRQTAVYLLSVIPISSSKISKIQRQKIARMISVKCPDELYPLIHSYWYVVTGEALDENDQTAYQSLSQTLEIKEAIERAMAFDTRMFLAGDVLTKVDRCSMAHSLEVRAPLLDHRVVEYAWGMNFNLKIRGGVQKYALRELLKRRLPVNLIDQKKQGFSIPHGEWLRGDLREWAESLFSPANIQKHGLISPSQVTPMWQAHKDGKADYGHYLWTVASLMNWAGAWRI